MVLLELILEISIFSNGKSMSSKVLDVGVSSQWLYKLGTGEPRVFTINSLQSFPTGIRQGDYGQFDSRSFRYKVIPGVGDTTHRLWVPPEIYEESLRVEAFATGAESAITLASQGLVLSLDSGGNLASKSGFLSLTAPQVLEGNSIAQLLPDYSDPAYIQAEYTAVAGAGSAWGLTQSAADMDLPAITTPFPYYFIASGSGYLAYPDTVESRSVNSISVFSEVGFFGAVALGCKKSYARLSIRNLFVISSQ